MSRPVRTVHATSKGEIDHALATADRIIVEGDEELLSYAIDRAAVEPEDRITIELPSRAARLPREPDEAPALRPAPVPTPVPRALGRANGRPREGVRQSTSFVAVAAGSIVGLGIVGAVVWLIVPGRRYAPNAVIEPHSNITGHEATDDFWANLPNVLWPVVATVAILALFLIARQAISSGNNVTIAWRVTEKVQGRVVITKIRDRTPGRRAA
ncbi:MAG TPA: hypothetical protein VKQ27_07350 [Acetobacteraceae bacterium]|nr:hypothetical protein [Acetobacteraceae bacterium]